MSRRCVGKALSPDESKFSSGSSGTMQSKKTVQSKTHFRTIAPKVAPKVVSSCPPSFPPSVADITASNAKPFIMQTQNYALMKVAGQDGTFSLVALPQVASSMGGQVIQTTSIPLQENPKLPIPRYPPSHEKKPLNKTSRVLNKTKLEKSVVGKSEDNKESIMKPDSKEEAATPKLASVTTAEEVVSESGLFPGAGAQVANVSNSALLFIDKAAPSMLPATSPAKLSVDFEKKAGLGDSGTLVKCKSAKVTDSTNPAAVLSPVVFGSPVHLLSSVPKGKLPILPYSKIKKSIISNCKQSAGPSKLPQSNVAQCGMQTSSDAQASSSVSISQGPTQGGPYPPVPKPDGNLSQRNGVPSKKRGKKRKTSSETLGYQTKMRLVGNRLIMCKERAKSQAVEASDKKTVTVKKYRNIMPKPFVDIQGFVSLSGSSSVLQSQASEFSLRNRMISVRTHRWRQNDALPVAQSDCKIPSLSAKLLYKCHICDHSFQFKHHLQDHLNSHSNKRPYHCRLCRKAYVHSGSLSTHMKLHHSDSRLKKLMCCEFCAKVFGHIRVYFGHLKEVHRVIISTESLAKQVERKSQTHRDETSMLDRDRHGNEDDALHGQTDEIRLQIKCGRCHFITPTFSDMKLHLLCIHGDEFKEILQDGVLENRQGAQEEVVKHATHHWKLLSEKRNVVKCYKCDEELFGSSRLRKHVCVSNSTHSELRETEMAPSVEGRNPPGQNDDLPSGSCTEIQFCCGNVFNCLLCKQVFEVQKELFEHWETKHNCDDPLVLWTIFSSLAKTDAK
ncbi:PREDICTED: zinc finger protein 438 [Nanorana parkeri]|uniref:zinc finger protein 438 n=1 Tax=Nanorana parkeri TaxID=125878 RepID=UPI0008541580|nr:PREDICTED: zinc finger protein 438 [Nanorana parkeri]